MTSAESVVREFGENTKQLAIDTAEEQGIVLDDAFYARCRAVNQAMVAILDEEQGAPAEIDQQTAELGEQFLASFGENQRNLVWLFIGCQAGFNLLSDGLYVAALESFGLVRSVAGQFKNKKGDFRAIFAAYGRTGLDKRHEPNRKLKDWTINLYEIGKYKSVKQFAKTVENDVLVEAKTLGAKINHYSARDTIATWIYGHKKSKSSP
ncbi:MAG: hypothetical protein IPJ38_15335 [Dechloromonas sp.]|uniref:Uncharacterized protein n=1 Tax=Candidatus Dechloromonas phosphorivorans TaxID=2899244 RepID=A0A935JZN4_9RHOO|nr:hypothetical protein [Candidatus Dechloromonas phosphorivorans]